MNVLFFSGGAYLGGMEMVTMHLMSALRDGNHDARAVVSGWNDGVYPRMLESRGVPNYQIKLGRLYLRKPTWTLDGILNYPVAVRALRRLLDDMQPDAILLPSIHLGLTVLPAIPRRYPVILYLHDVPDKSFLSLMGRYVFSRLCGVIAVSGFVGKLFHEMMPNVSIQVVHNGLLDASGSFQFVRQDSTDLLRVGVVGWVIPRKRQEKLVRIAAAIREKGVADIRFVIYGESDTEYGLAIRKEISRIGLENYFEWPGFRERQEDIYGNIDVVAAPSVSEPFGLTVLEAGLWGLPVVVSRSGGFCEMVVDGVTGFLVDPEDPNEMANRLIELRDEEKRKMLGNAAMLHINKNFSVDIMKKNFLLACDHLVNR